MYICLLVISIWMLCKWVAVAVVLYAWLNSDHGPRQQVIQLDKLKVAISSEVFLRQSHRWFSRYRINLDQRKIMICFTSNKRRNILITDLTALRPCCVLVTVISRFSFFSGETVWLLKCVWNFPFVTFSNYVILVRQIRTLLELLVVSFSLISWKFYPLLQRILMSKGETSRVIY